MRILILCMVLALAVGCNKKTVKAPVIEPVTVNITVPPVPDTGTIPFIIPDDPTKPPVIVPKDIRDTVYFDFDSDLIRPDQAGKLVKIRDAAINGRIATLNLLGGASPEGSELYNYRLSLRRSEAVKQFLGTFTSIKYYIYGKGETDLVTNYEPEWWRNRNCIISSR